MGDNAGSEMQRVMNAYNTLPEDSLLRMEIDRALSKHDKNLHSIAAAEDGNGKLCDILLAAMAAGAAAERAYETLASDLRVVREENARLAGALYTDSLTMLPNMAGFDRLFASSANIARVSGSVLSVAYGDVDNFKTFNTDYGHPCANAMLGTIGSYFARALRRNDGFFARPHGDEFLAVISSGADGAAAALGRIIHGMSTDRTFLDELYRAVQESRPEKKTPSLSMTFGIYPIPQDEIAGRHTDIEKYIALANKAVMHAKTNGGKGRAHIYNPDMHGG